jgi:isopenicillin N synthase-like dioxygenase
LTREGEWIKATPILGTIVVNIGDSLQRVSNDRFVSTTHRVFSRAQSDHISMPSVFGFNFNEKVGVLESCLAEGEVAKYEPMSCEAVC